MAKKTIGRRDFVKAAALGGGAMVLPACAAPAAPAAAAATAAPAVVPAIKPKIVIWCGTTYTTEADAAMDTQIKDWCAANNVDLELNRMSMDERVPKWQTAFEAKQFPDMGLLEQNDASKFMVANHLVDTSSVLNNLNKMEGGYTPGAWANTMFNGKHLTVPTFSSTEVFYVRKDKLEEKGLAIPETWEDVVKVAKAITVPGQFWGYGAQIGTPSWDSEVQISSQLFAYGASTWDKDGKVALDSKETRQVLDLMNDAWKSGVIPSDASTWDDGANNKAYLTGMVGMTWNTPSVLKVMEKDDPDLLSKTAITLLPKGPKGRFTTGYYYQWGVFNTSKHPDVCLALMEHLFQPAQLRTVYDLSAGNMMPIFKNMINDDMWKKSPQREMVTKMVEFTVPQGYPGANTPWIQDAWMDHTCCKMLNRVLFDGWDNDRAIAEAVGIYQKWYDEWQVKLKA
ncbi:MAG: putative ABC transporter-binding protein [Nitrospira sp.]|nr:putative ABC transporter-binding protein [Nitrospira sp.]